MEDLINYWLPVMIWMGGLYWGYSQPVLPGPLSSPPWEGLLLRKTVHLMEYAVLVTLLWRALLNNGPIEARAEHRESNDPLPATLSLRRWTLLLAFLIALLYALFDERHQSLVSSRDARLLHVGIDMMGTVTALGLIWWRSALK